MAPVYNYIIRNGVENFRRLLAYLGKAVLQLELPVLPPLDLPWEGLYHPQATDYFTSAADYLSWYRTQGLPSDTMVGLLFSRHDWVVNNLELEDFLIQALEARGLGVIPVFYYSLKDEGLGTRGGDEIVRDYFLDIQGQSRVAALVKLTVFFLGSMLP